MGFEGFVVSDCGAIGFMVTNHKWARPNGTAYTAAEATAASVAAGLDLNCGGMFGSHLRDVYDAGTVTPAMVDAAARRVVRGYFELGLFQDTAAAKADWRRPFP